MGTPNGCVTKTPAQMCHYNDIYSTPYRKQWEFMCVHGVPCCPLRSLQSHGAKAEASGDYIHHSENPQSRP